MSDRIAVLGARSIEQLTRMRWTQERKQLRHDIRTTVRRASPMYVVRGSFGHGDFHLSRNGQTSFSDLDLLYPGCGDLERVHRAQSIQELLDVEHGLRLRVSVQPADMYTSLSPSDSRYLAIGEYLRHCDEYARDAARSSYLLAKATLAVLRSGAQERYGETADRLRCSASRHALCVKLGMYESFEFSEAQQLLTSGPPEAADLVAVVRHGAPDEEIRRRYAKEIRLRISIPIWLRELVASLVEERANHV